MRRISLAVALLGAVAAAGCSGGGDTPDSSGTSRGIPGSTFTVVVRGDNATVDPANPVIYGTVHSGTISAGTFIPDGKIVCGSDAATQLCSADYPWGTTGLVLKATPDSANGYGYWGFAGSCSGNDTCALSGNADKMVLVRFAKTFAGLGAHPNFSDPAVHKPAAFNLNCTQCHGSTLEGLGLAPACASCHTAAQLQSMVKTGLNVAIDSVSTSAPIAVQFRLTDDSGQTVDVTGLGVAGGSRKNQPMPITMALAYFGTDSSGNYLNYVSSTAGNPGTTAVRSVTGNTTSGTLTSGFQNGVACTTAAPCTCTSANPCNSVVTTGTQDGVACTASAPCTCSAAHPCGPALAGANGPGALTFDASTGVYTYTFPATVAFSTSLENATLWIQTTRQENLTTAFDARKFTAVNKDHNFKTPGVGSGTPVARRIVDEAACARCHDGFPAEANATGTGWAGFHSGARNNPGYCNICHYANRGIPARTYTDGGADSKAFVHRIHSAEHMGAPTANWFHGIGATYPQDLRNCKQCHPDTAQGRQYKTRPTRVACNGCHYNVVYTADPVAATSIAHPGGTQADDSGCATCHTATAIDAKHLPVLPPDPANCFSQNGAAGCSNNTNAAYIPAAGAMPPGAAAITWEIGTVSRDANRNPVISFKFKNGGSDVVFNACGQNSSTYQLMDGFVGAPSVYFVWSAPQDGIAAPADFNASASLYVRTACNAPSANYTMTGPDGSGFYTITLKNVIVSDAARMLTGGVGYSYNISSALPLTQVSLAEYPYDPATKVGGLVLTPPNVSKVAAGYTGRRTIVSSARCNNCHAQLGVGPTFHGGQRNDAGSCSWCHTPNRTSSAWAANAKDFIHAIHGGKKRTAEFNWHAACPSGTTFVQNTSGSTNSGTCRDASNNVVGASPWYPGIEFPGAKCTDCHEPGTFDYSAPASAAALANMLPSTAATGTFSAATASLSPHVTLGQAYGTGFSYASATGNVTQAAGTTLINSPISAACFGCHDGAEARAHMTTMGGKIYQPRSGGLGSEACLACHGAGKVVDISRMH